MKRIKTPFDQLKAVMEKHWCQPLGGKSAFDDEQIKSIKAMAAELPLKDIEEDVPLTDGELLKEAFESTPDDASSDGFWLKVAAEFLRLRRERDGEPLDVTAEWIDRRWRMNADNCLESLARDINAHRGVRPVPKLTAEMLDRMAQQWWLR